MVKGEGSKEVCTLPPKSLLESLGLRERATVKYEIDGGRLIVESIMDPLESALNVKKWARTSIEEFEESKREQELHG
ncbi:AbrB/MazE/SpoVT family DNA-binding domain-containing protein [Candidatus Bathyarchaeota archaeon]|nr:AbrB/MazE/SpoVT family DNA-binding domain-containing protein [Candidatus Bathyarchaeota archaeon]MBS7626905.1 AbrB/MazE/SpoVT family DNA-binding domain-containing protein [Candidatus Bathyarchaeota archaeon]